MPDHTARLAAAIDAVARASIVCRSVQAAMDQVRAIIKDDNSPVTIADFASQAVVGRVLADHLGSSNVVLVAEETSTFLRNPTSSAHLEATLAAVADVWPNATADELLTAIDTGASDTHHTAFWTLDPIDGTKGFLRGQQYCVCLAYIERGEPVIGVLGCPNLPRDFSADLDRPDPVGSIYLAVRGDGLYELPCSLDATSSNPVHIRRLDHDPTEPISVTASVEESHSNLGQTEQVLAIVQPPDRRRPPTRLDSQCKYAVVARGQADAYLRLPSRKGYVERIWDHAAGSLVASEGGCFVTDIHGHALDFSHGRGLEKNKGIVAAPPRVHGKLIAAIQQLGL